MNTTGQISSFESSKSACKGVEEGIRSIDVKKERGLTTDNRHDKYEAICKNEQKFAKRQTDSKGTEANILQSHFDC